MEVHSSVVVSPEFNVDEINISAVSPQNHVVLLFVRTFSVNINVTFWDDGVEEEGNCCDVNGDGDVFPIFNDCEKICS